MQIEQKWEGESESVERTGPITKDNACIDKR